MSSNYNKNPRAAVVFVKDGGKIYITASGEYAQIANSEND